MKSSRPRSLQTPCTSGPVRPPRCAHRSAPRCRLGAPRWASCARVSTGLRGRACAPPSTLQRFERQAENTCLRDDSRMGTRGSPWHHRPDVRARGLLERRPPTPRGAGGRRPACAAPCSPNSMAPSLGDERPPKSCPHCSWLSVPAGIVAWVSCADPSGGPCGVSSTRGGRNPGGRVTQQGLRHPAETAAGSHLPECP